MGVQHPDASRETAAAPCSPLRANADGHKDDARARSRPPISVIHRPALCAAAGTGFPLLSFSCQNTIPQMSSARLSAMTTAPIPARPAAGP
jgi:hypothetical protein